eukprot:CAMPEP_0114313342 /NCGR_PEP_ID=MMETSP0059-20121206/21056_1 /TAXON_ID=36894 /ORGANISM="Pyramimonas parkeae, Strain CCMP726" /LENGTH=125 /DNA_ID=CAMNT_0001438075 /DNA_START=41 /DNA_END=418 /DNA_ORIENTATION=+
MVLIIDGDLVSDDDPRAQARRRQLQAARSSSQQTNTRDHASQVMHGASSSHITEPPPPRGSSGTDARIPSLDWSQPALRLVPAPAASAFLGMPDAQVFGLHVRVRRILNESGLSHVSLLGFVSCA